VQLFFDLETVAWAERYAKGVAWEDNPPNLDRWVATAKSDHLFAEDPGQVRRMRSVYRAPRFFAPTELSRELVAPRNVMDEIKAEARSLIARHDYQPDAAILGEVEKVIAHARRHPPE